MHFGSGVCLLMSLGGTALFGLKHIGELSNSGGQEEGDLDDINVHELEHFNSSDLGTPNYRQFAPFRLLFNSPGDIQMSLFPFSHTTPPLGREMRKNRAQHFQHSVNQEQLPAVVVTMSVQSLFLG